MTIKPIDDHELAHITGGNWDDFKNLMKGAANGGVNFLNFFHDHPVKIVGELSVGGDRIQKPFTNDPLSRIGVRNGRAVPEKKK